MKRRYKKLLSVLGACVLSVPFAGCETDAEEVDGVQTNTTSSTPVSATSTNTSTATIVTTSGDAEANAPEIAASEGGTNSVNQQTTIIQRIPATIPADVKLSPGVLEVVKLLQSGVSETVVLLFVEKSTESFELDAADIVYLNDIGVSATVLAAMLNHDGAEPDVLHNALGTNALAEASAASAPTTVPIVTNYVTQPAPQVEVSSNFVAGPQYGGTPVVQADPNAQVQVQQPVVIEQQQPQVVVTQPQVTYSYFYDSLSPYGSWVYVTDYGWCWQPTIAVTHRAWRPYMHGGRWLYSDVGWYWHSDYSWGWAPFHYGRWHCSPRVGWVWTPDYTWGPSWVTWRRTGDYCGWAPLPPYSYVRPGIGFSYWGRDYGFNFSFGYSHDFYTFVPTRRFCDRRVIDHVVPTERTRNIYRDSTVVNNYINGNNNTIINNGVGRDYVASRTQNEIPRVRVQDSTGGARVAPDRLVRNGAETVVFRPQRPPERLVAAHEQAVARTRTEVARTDRTANGVSPRENMITSRSGATGRPEALSANSSSAVRPTSPRAGTSPATRSETARPQITSRGNAEVPIPARGTPAPVRPEPDRSAEILRTRIAQESRVRPSGSGATVGSVGGATVGGGVVSPAPGARPGLVRPNAPARTEVPRSEIPSGVVPQPSTRPGAPAVSTQPSNRPAQRGNEVVRPRTETSRPTTETPSGRTVPTTPATSPSFSRPSANAQTQTAQNSGVVATPQVVRPTQPAQSPAFARPAPNNNAAPNVSRPTISGGYRQSTLQQPQVTAPAPAQPVQRPTYQQQAPAPVVRPSITPRNESFSRPAPSVPVQRSAPVQSVQPRAVQPTAPSQRPAMVRPQASTPAPPARLSSPSRPVQSAPVSRPSSSGNAGNSGNGRGRVEIGR